MHQRNLLARIENAERVANATPGQTFSGGCICFPKNEQPFFGWPVEGQIAAQLKCPQHGERFKTERFYIYAAKWLRVKLWGLLSSHHSEQYRKAWFASFPPALWPASEDETDGSLCLKLKDGTPISVNELSERENKRKVPRNAFTDTTSPNRTRGAFHENENDILA